jgi:hypothetical protein
MRAGSFSFLATGLMFLILATASHAENGQSSMSPVDLRPSTLLQKKIAACADKSWGDLCSFLVQKQTIRARCAPVKGQLVCGPKRKVSQAASTSTEHETPP